MPEMPAASIKSIAEASRHFRMKDLVVLPHARAGSPESLQRYLPGNVLIQDKFTADQIKILRRQFGTLEPYIYCYRPSQKFLPAECDQAADSKYAAYLENASRHADVGFPLPGATAEEFLRNVLADICYTGDLVAPSPRFASEYTALAERLRTILPRAELHHIGSTALGIMTKPVLDMLLVVPRDIAFESVVPALHELGFYWVDYPGNETRWYFRYGFPRQMHIHLVRQGSEEERIHLLFRDRLLANEQLRSEYEQLKVGLSSRYSHDRAAYGRAKSAFIESVLA